MTNIPLIKVIKHTNDIDTTIIYIENIFDNNHIHLLDKISDHNLVELCLKLK